jgi:hypothetical protein
MTTPKRAATAAAKRRLFVSVGRPSALPRDTTRERYVEQVITHATECSSYFALLRTQTSSNRDGV